MKKIIISIVVICIALGGFLVAYLLFGDKSPEAPELLGSSSSEAEKRVIPEGEIDPGPFVLPTFEEVGFDAPHTYDKSTYAFRGSALIDVDGDGVEELWLAGDAQSNDSLFKYQEGTLKNIASESGIEKKNAVSAGALSLDMDNDGDVDLVIARDNGVFLLTNTNGQFSQQKIEMTIEGDAVPFSVSAGDINKDGWADLYVSTFIAFDKFQSAAFNNVANRTKNIMLLNNGDGTFTDITESSGLSFDQNTFQTIFVDLDGDTWQDLIVAPNTDKVYVYKNGGDGTFERMPALAEYGFWMGLAVDDFDGDGDQDFFVSNVGETIPQSVGKGDLSGDQVLDRQWRLFRNDGNFQFTDVAESVGMTDQKFGWGAMFGDINNDGNLDIAVAENYVKWPTHKLNKLPGSFFVQKDGAYHRQISALEVENPFYGTTPLFSDFTGDGHPEIIYVNMDDSSRLFRNSATPNNHITLAIPDTAEMIGAVAKLTLSNGDEMVRHKIVGQGLMSDGTADMIFGLGARVDVEKIEVTLSSGEVVEIAAPELNQRILMQ